MPQALQTNAAAGSVPEIDLDLIRRFDGRGPRYTSYPTADRFTDRFDAAAYRAWLARRGVAGMARPLSLYIHLPFCSTLCFYCGCNKIVTRDRNKGEVYLDYLGREMALQAAALGGDKVVHQMHWGGGTPNFFTIPQVTALMAKLREHFTFDPQGEYSVELDPRHADAQYIAGLAALGVNRISLGVQDFEPEVQRAVHRLQSEAQTIEVIEAARTHGLRGVNVDLMYGLPKQTLESFERTLERVIAAAPDRLAVYNYAHIPTLFKPQQRIREEDLPTPDTRLKLLTLAITRLTGAGYVYIGMDHFARADDGLSVAQREGRLHRNFQGYSTHADSDLLALGVSAIGNIGPTYSQNYRTAEEYYACLDRGELPVMRGLELTDDDLLRRAVIGTLMCHFALDKQAVARAHGIDFDAYFADELAQLREMQDLGMVELDAQGIRVTLKGRLLVRNVSMVFDRYLRKDEQQRRYSRVI